MRLLSSAVFSLLLVACAPDPDSIAKNPPPPPAESPAADDGTAPEGSEDAVGNGPEAPESPADEPAPTPEPPGDPVPGIDVSHYQGEVDWAKVKSAGITFAFAKATEGTTEVDPAFKANWEAMEDAGIIRGAYAYYVAGEDPAKQAAHFLATVPLESGVLPPAVDIETKGKSAEGNAPLAADLRTYLAAIEKATGVKGIIYTSPTFWNEHFDDTFGEFPLWVAEYGVDEPKPVKGWEGWTFWQQSQDGTVDGVTGKVDLDTFAESAASLRGLALP